ncbi:MAG TPA: tetratricopeptide repeat protein [Herpetosiphonaceae bacterium]|nr:tetratricopeptide repeat protein [Herpetosiphonaceae bacterium]
MPTQRAQSRQAPRSRRWSRRTVSVAAAALALLGLGSIVVPWLMWAAQINRAAELIEQGISWPEPRSSDTIPTVSDPQRLAEARLALDAAIGWRPDNAQAFRLRGQIAMAEGGWAEAKTAFGEAGRRAPANPLIIWEQALAHERRYGIGWAPADPAQTGELRRLWQQAGMSMERFIARGDEARFRDRTDEALRWYGRASVFEPGAGIPWYYAGLAYERQDRNAEALQAYRQALSLQPDLGAARGALAARADRLFRQGAWADAAGFYRLALETPDQPADFKFRAALAGSSANAPPRDLLAALGVPIYAVAGRTTIEGETMHWLGSSNPELTDGTAIKPGYVNKTWVAALWWQGAVAAIVDAPAGGYVLKARAASTPGAAAQLAIEIDGQPVETFETMLDGSFSERQVRVDLEGGTHVLTVRFLNNGVFNGVDNNAYIDWLGISR